MPRKRRKSKHLWLLHHPTHTETHPHLIPVYKTLCSCKLGNLRHKTLYLLNIQWFSGLVTDCGSLAYVCFFWQWKIRNDRESISLKPKNGFPVICGNISNVVMSLKDKTLKCSLVTYDCVKEKTKMNLQSHAPAQFWKEKKKNLPLKETKSIPSSN